MMQHYNLDLADSLTAFLRSLSRISIWSLVDGLDDFNLHEIEGHSPMDFVALPGPLLEVPLRAAYQRAEFVLVK
jgi:hypothetical protein